MAVIVHYDDWMEVDNYTGFGICSLLEHCMPDTKLNSNVKLLSDIVVLHCQVQ